MNKKQLIKEYKRTLKPMGVDQIKNMVVGVLLSLPVRFAEVAV